MVLVALLAPLAVDAVWLKHIVLDTDRFVGEVGPLVDDPHVQDQIVDTVTEQLTSKVDIEGRLQQQLPDQLRFLGPIASRQAVDLVRSVTRSIVVSDRFSAIFKKSLRASHSLVINTLTGKGRTSVKDGVIYLDLTELRDRVVARIDDTPLGSVLAFPETREVQVAVVESPGLAKAQSFVNLLDALGFWLPVVTLALAGLAIVLAVDRRRAVMWVGVWTSVSMAVHLALIAFGRDLYLGAVTKTLDKGAASSIYDLFLRIPRTSSRAALVLGLIVALGAVLAGPSKGALSVRSLWGRATGSAGGVLDEVGPLSVASAFVASHRSAFTAGVLGLGALVLVFSDRLLIPTVLWTTVAVLVMLGVIAVLAAAAPTTSTKDTPVENPA